MSTGVSLGLRALLLIRLDGRPGEWVSVADLAQTHRMAPERVREGLLSLQAEGYVQCRPGADGMIEAACSAVKG